MVVCWRCGVEFDGTDYLRRVPCPDCQLEDITIEYRKLSVVRKAEAQRRDELVRTGWEDRQSDGEIGADIGMGVSGVRDVRHRLGLAAHTFSGTEKWPDEAAVRELQSKASLAYWANPQRKPRRNGKGKPLSGDLTHDSQLRTHAEIDKRYGGNNAS